MEVASGDDEHRRTQDSTNADLRKGGKRTHRCGRTAEGCRCSLVKKQGDAAALVGEDEVSDGGGGGARAAEEGVRGRRRPEEMKKT